LSQRAFWSFHSDFYVITKSDQGNSVFEKINLIKKRQVCIQNQKARGRRPSISDDESSVWKGPSVQLLEMSSCPLPYKEERVGIDGSVCH